MATNRQKFAFAKRGAAAMLAVTLVGGMCPSVALAQEGAEAAPAAVEAKALLSALLTPHAKIKAFQDAGDFTSLLAMQEELKSYPFAAVWDEYCARQGVPVRENWLAEVRQYEKDVLSRR